MKREYGAYLYLTLAMTIVGSSVVFGQIITQAFPVFLASGMRFALASLVLVPLVAGPSRRPPRLPGRDWLILVLMAFCGQFMFTLFLLWGLRLTSAMEAGLITSTTPAAMALVALVVLRERLTLRSALGVGLALAGVLIINGLPEASVGEVRPGRIWGNLLVCGAVLGEAVFLLLRKSLSPALDNLALTAALSFLGFLMFLPPALYQAAGFDFQGVSLKEWAAILYFGFVFTVAAYIFWFKGVARVSGTTAGAFSAVMPVSAVVLSGIFLGERFTWVHGLGGVLILGAIGLMTWKRGKGMISDADAWSACSTHLPWDTNR